MEPDALSSANGVEGDVWEGGGKRYRMEKVVGNGAFGIVWKAREEGGGMVAIKKVVLDRRYHNRELEMMKQLEHECVIRLLNYFEKPGRKRDETYLHLVMDFLPETIRSVAMQYHKQRQRFPTDHVRVYLYQALKALEYVHSLRICHRDLKPDNFLVDPMRLTLKLIDFGCAKVLQKGQPNVSYICSRYYRAPELLFGATEYTCAVDMWSIGTILAELLLGHLPFQGQDSTQQHLIEIMKLLGTPSDRELRAMRATCNSADLPKLKAYPWDRVFPSSSSSRAVDLAHRLLCFDPAQRVNAAQGLVHPFFEGVKYTLAGDASQTPAAPPPSNAHWQQQTAPLFEAFLTSRSKAILEPVPAFEARLAAKLQQIRPDAVDAVMEAVRSEMAPLFATAEQTEVEAVRALREQVRASLRCDGANGSAENGEASKLNDQLRQLKEDGEDSPAARKRQATRKELAALQTQLDTLNSALAKQRAAATAKARVDLGTQTDPMPDSRGKSPPTGPGGASLGRRNSSGRSSAVPYGSETQPSPMLARPSAVMDMPGSDAGSRRHGGPSLSSMAPDNLGQMTPMGVSREASVREPSGGDDHSPDTPM